MWPCTRNVDHGSDSSPLRAVLQCSACSAASCELEVSVLVDGIKKEGHDLQVWEAILLFAALNVCSCLLGILLHTRPHPNPVGTRHRFG